MKRDWRYGLYHRRREREACEGYGGVSGFDPFVQPTLLQLLRKAAVSVPMCSTYSEQICRRLKEKIPAKSVIDLTAARDDLLLRMYYYNVLKESLEWKVSEQEVILKSMNDSGN